MEVILSRGFANTQGIESRSKLTKDKLDGGLNIMTIGSLWIYSAEIHPILHCNRSALLNIDRKKFDSSTVDKLSGRILQQAHD